MFIGRKQELASLEDAYKSNRSQIVVVYGRRRVGKSELVSRFLEGKHHSFSCEALENEQTPGQIVHFLAVLKQQIDDPLLESLRFSSWEHVFNYLESHIKKSKGKFVLFFDEIQWMAAGQGKLISLLKFYWDNHWKKETVLLILCGSVASFMVNKVLKSKALYGRISLELPVFPLLPDEAAKMFEGKRSSEEILNYQLVFGGIPKYLEEIKLNKSFEQNMKMLCFSPNGILLNEMERIFYSQFKEAATYLKIVKLLGEKAMSTGEVGKMLGIASGGGLKLYLQNLLNAAILGERTSFHKGLGSKDKRYYVCDEYIRFYFKFIEPNLKAIERTRNAQLFKKLTAKNWDIWMGFAFERFCLKHAAYLAEIMGFQDEVVLFDPYFEKGDKGFQIDLLYKRSDKVITVCEIKHYNKPISTTIIREVERKCKLLKVPRGYTIEKALISLYGPDQSLEYSQYFHHTVSMKDIIRC